MRRGGQETLKKVRVPLSPVDAGFNERPHYILFMDIYKLLSLNKQSE